MSRIKTINDSRTLVEIFILKAPDIRDPEFGPRRVPVAFSTDYDLLNEFHRNCQVEVYFDEDLIKFFSKGSALEYSYPDVCIDREVVTEKAFKSIKETFKDAFIEK